MSIRMEHVGTVAVVTLDDPTSRNALTGQSASQLIECLRQAEATSHVCSVLIRGEAGNFCSGADRALLARVRQAPGDVAVIEELEAIYAAFGVLAALDVPTIAAVRGSAVGAGVNLALAADVRVVSTKARFISGFLRIQLHPGGGHFLMLDRLAGPQAAAAMTLLGDQVSGEDLVRRGLAWDAVPDAEVDARALELAGGAQDPELVRVATRSFRAQAASRQMPLAAASRAEQAAQLWSIARSGEGRQPAAGEPGHPAE